MANIRKVFADGSFETLISEIKSYIINGLSGKANVSHAHDDLYYTKEQIDAMEFITEADIDTICGTTIQMAREVMF